MKPIAGIAGMLWVALFVLGFGCVMQEGADGPERGGVLTAPRMGISDSEEDREPWAVFVEALKADPAAPDLSLVDADWEDVDPGLQQYLLGRWAEIVGEESASSELPTSWTCIKLAFNDDPGDDCPVRTKPEQG
ncbi:MAG: hypothetical protein FJY73_09860 [Candidatus Eisenbacteria bacterium]|nr:hypothetical protein [Candidatus Eisenbacteria bacterium]